MLAPDPTAAGGDEPGSSPGSATSHSQGGSALPDPGTAWASTGPVPDRGRQEGPTGASVCPSAVVSPGCTDRI